MSQDAPKVRAKEKDKDKETGTPMKDDEFDLPTLRENAVSIFGVPHYVIDGALHGEKPKATYTKAEIQEKVDKFMKEEVK
jgi:hypothetical protein